MAYARPAKPRVRLSCGSSRRRIVASDSRSGRSGGTTSAPPLGRRSQAAGVSGRGCRRRPVGSPGRVALEQACDAECCARSVRDGSCGLADEVLHPQERAVCRGSRALRAPRPPAREPRRRRPPPGEPVRVPAAARTPQTRPRRAPCRGTALPAAPSATSGARARRSPCRSARSRRATRAGCAAPGSSGRQ